MIAMHLHYQKYKLSINEQINFPFLIFEESMEKKWKTKRIICPVLHTIASKKIEKKIIITMELNIVRRVLYKKTINEVSFHQNTQFLLYFYLIWFG